MEQDCRDCGGVMEAGFIPDAHHPYDYYQSGWHPGAPSRSWFGHPEVDREDMYPLSAYRCQQCGLLKLYALPPEKR